MQKHIGIVVLQVMEQTGEQKSHFRDKSIGAPFSSGIPDMVGGVISQLRHKLEPNQYIATNYEPLAQSEGIEYYSNLKIPRRVGFSYS